MCFNIHRYIYVLYIDKYNLLDYYNWLWNSLKCSFKWPSLERWQCPIYNGTLETLIWLKMWKISSFFWLEKCLILINSPFCRETANENKQFEERKLEYPIHTCSNEAFESTFVNRVLPVLPVLHGSRVGWNYAIIHSC